MKVFQFFGRRPATTACLSNVPDGFMPHYACNGLIYHTYEALSTAPVETLWQTLINLADISSWHPLIDSTNAPRGLMAKPGLIYRVIPRWLPIPVQIFVERVSPPELISIRLLSVPGLEERVIYRLESTVWGTQISHSICLRGWLSPLAWSVLRPFAPKIAEAIARAAENTTLPALPRKKSGFGEGRV